MRLCIKQLNLVTDTRLPTMPYMAAKIGRMNGSEVKEVDGQYGPGMLVVGNKNNPFLKYYDI